MAGAYPEQAWFALVYFNDDGSAYVGERYLMTLVEARRCVHRYNQDGGGRFVSFAVLTSDVDATRAQLRVMFPVLFPGLTTGAQIPHTDR
ncbi:MAG TPA: hypothetical protein VJ777_19285 [Mycobacterium sp.]|nr:hypothetical protein [Mycobacterium sp.]